MVFPPGTLSCSSQNPINLSHPHVAIFFFSCFCFCFCFCFFIVYIQVQTARLSEQILVFVLLDNNNNKTTKKKLSRLVSLVRKRATKCPILNKRLFNGLLNLKQWNT